MLCMLRAVLWFTLLRSDTMKSNFAQQCKSFSMNSSVVARSQAIGSVLVAVARQC